MEGLDYNIDEVNSKKEFVDFLDVLVHNYEIGDEEFENYNTAEFLKSIKEFCVFSIESYCKFHNIPFDESSFNWNMFARIIDSGTI